MADQNPFSSYTVDDQNTIADQLRTARDSGKLNPAQTQGVASALKYLPMSKQESSQYMTGLATMGQGTWQKPQTAPFSDISPDMMAFGRKGSAVNPLPSPHATPEYGEAGLLKRPDQFHPGNLSETAGPIARGQVERVTAASQANDQMLNFVGNKGAQVGAAALSGSPTTIGPMPNSPETRGIGAGVGRFTATTLADPITYATASLGGLGKVGQAGLSAAFSVQMAHGAIQGAGELGSIWDRDDIPRDRKIELGTNITLNSLMAGLAGTHTVKSFLDNAPANIPAVDRAEIQQRLESEWKQQPNGQMIRRTAEPSVTDNRVVNRNVNDGDLSRQFPEGSFQNRMISKKGIPITPKPDGAEFAKTVDDTPVSQTGVLDADGLKEKQNSGEQFHASDPSTASGLEQMAMMGGTISHSVLEPKTISGASDRVSTPEVSKADTDFYAQAKQEWMDKNPGQSPDRGISEIARRSNELKTGVADPTLNPSASKTPVSEPAKDLSIREKAQLLKPDRGGITDLRAVDPEVRHSWINQKSFFEIKGATDAADAAAKARSIFGPDKRFTINSFIDKDGALRHGVQSLLNEAGTAIDEHPQPGPASPHMTPKGEELFNSIQTGEGKFNELTGGKHSQVLESLWNATKATLPDAPHESRLGLYNKGLSSLLDAARDAKSINDFQKAFDIVTKKGEGGFANPLGRQRISDADAKMLAKVHAETVLNRWENLPDGALKNRKVEKKLTDPALRNSVYGAGDPALEGRYEALLDRSSKLRASDPIAVLGHTLDGHSIGERDITTGALREGMGAANRSKEMRTKALQSYRDEWRSRPISDTIRFLDAVENGDLQSITDPRDRDMAAKFRDLLDSKRDKIRDLGREIMRTRVAEYDRQIANAKSPEQAKMWQYERKYIQQHLDAGETSLLNKFNENYFPHMWRYGIKDMAANLMQGRRPFAPRNFLKQRTYSTFTEGIADGMEPVTYNPVDMVLLKLHEMDRFATAHSTFNMLKDRGLAHIFSPDQVPDGWTKVNDTLFNAGENAAWYMPKDAAEPFNRHLSPGLRGNIAYDTIAHYNNLINQFNLGMSAFHGVETGVNAVASRAGLGLVKLSRFAEFPANLKGLKDVALSPLAPIMAPIEGRKVAAQYMDPSRYAKYEATANAVETANGRIHMPSEYTNQATEAFRNAWKEAAFAQSKGMPGRALSKAALGTFRALGALMEQTGKPIMEWQVPSTKLGVFHWMAQDILERLPADASKEMIQKEFGYAWDRVDDRFGQVVYDNLFWNRMAKDLSHLAIRSVGWNYGDVRELGGAVWDLRDKASLKAAVTGKGISQKQGYVLGLLGVTAMMGYTLNHIYGQKIDDPITDLLYPKNGKMNSDGSAQRIYLKTYIHDAYQFSHAPGETGFNKTAPIWHQIGDMYKNADYYGTQIHPIHATTGDALTDPSTYTSTGKYLIDQAAPFSARNFQQRRAQGEDIVSSLTSTAAILPAPKWVGQSKAELLAFELFKTKLKQGPNDAVKDESVRRYHELASGYAANRYTAKDVANAFKKGEITSKQLDGILDDEEGKLSPLERHVKQLEPHELLRVWEVASPDEKKVLTDKFLHAWDTIDDKYTANDKLSLNLQKRFISDWQTFVKSKQSN